MKFEIGKCYAHPSGEEISIVGEVNTTLYGAGLVARSPFLLFVSGRIYQESSNSKSKEDNFMKFEIGKYYAHPSGEQISIVGEVTTTLYGVGLVAESSNHAYLKPVGKDESHAENWTEISKEEWMRNFTQDDKEPRVSTTEKERLHLKKCDYHLGYCGDKDPQCECEAAVPPEVVRERTK